MMVPLFALIGQIDGMPLRRLHVMRPQKHAFVPMNRAKRHDFSAISFRYLGAASGRRFGFILREGLREPKRRLTPHSKSTSLAHQCSKPLANDKQKASREST